MDPDTNYAEQHRFTCLTIGKNFGHIWWNPAFEGDPTSRALGHDAVVYLDEGKQACFDRSTGPLLTDVARRVILDSRPLALYNGPDPVVFHLAPSFEYGSKAKFPWKGDLVLVAIYGRPFTARELTDARNKLPSALVPEFVETKQEPSLPAKQPGVDEAPGINPATGLDGLAGMESQPCGCRDESARLDDKPHRRQSVHRAWESSRLRIP